MNGFRNLALPLALAIFALAPVAEARVTPVLPEKDGYYPAGQVFDPGPCKPETPLGGGTNGARATRTHDLSQYLQSANLELWGEYAPTTEVQDGRDHGGPCEARTEASYTEAVPLAPLTDHVVLTVPGEYEYVEKRVTTTYVCCNQYGRWSASPDVSATDENLAAIHFHIYNPCQMFVSTVTGDAVWRRSTGPTELRRGVHTREGEQIIVRSGTVTLVNGSGTRLDFGKGTYRLDTRENCRRLTADRPKGSPPMTLEDGAVTQKTGRTVGGRISAGKVRNDAVFPRRNKGAAAEPLRFRVTRSKARRTTTSCALTGALLVETTDKRVPARRRKLTVRQGECARTVDGQAPRLIG